MPQRNNSVCMLYNIPFICHCIKMSNKVFSKLGSFPSLQPLRIKLMPQVVDEQSLGGRCCFIAAITHQINAPGYQ